MHRKSTDLEYYRDKKLVIDADGVEVTLPVEPFELSAGAEEAARSAKTDADRAANIASSTSWDGDKLTVNGKTSPSLTGPKGDPGEVTKAQLDTAIASEKARTVGMVWMVETEAAAQAKEPSCQKGDFIQVAATGNIYQVV